MGTSPSLPEKNALRQREIESQLSAMHSPVAGARAAAARRLGDLQAGSDALLGALNDPHETVRSAAALALGNFNGSDQTAEIIDTLLAAIDDPSEKVCQAAIRSLGTLKAEIARPEILSLVDVLTPNAGEAALLVGASRGGGHANDDPSQAQTAALQLRALGCRAVVVTLGPRGCQVVDDQVTHIPGRPVAAVDATAAGDAFNGALAVSLSEGGSLADAARFANAAAAISVTRLGAQPSLPTRFEIEDFAAS